LAPAPSPKTKRGFVLSSPLLQRTDPSRESQMIRETALISSCHPKRISELIIYEGLDDFIFGNIIGSRVVPAEPSAHTIEIVACDVFLK